MPKPGIGRRDAQAVRAEIDLLHGLRQTAVDVGHQGAPRNQGLTVRLPHGERQADRAEVIFQAACDRFPQREFSGERHLRGAERAAGIRSRGLDGGIDSVDAVRRACDGRLSRRHRTRLARSSRERHLVGQRAGRLATGSAELSESRRFKHGRQQQSACGSQDRLNSFCHLF